MSKNFKKVQLEPPMQIIQTESQTVTAKQVKLVYFIAEAMLNFEYVKQASNSDYIITLTRSEVVLLDKEK